MGQIASLLQSAQKQLQFLEDLSLVPLSMEAPECAQASPIYAMHVVVKRIKADGGFVYRGDPRWEECIFRYLPILFRVSLLHVLAGSTFAPTPTVSVLF